MGTILRNMGCYGIKEGFISLQMVIDRAHYFAHPGVKKMYAYMKKLFFFPGMKRDVAGFVSKCLEC